MVGQMAFSIAVIIAFSAGGRIVSSPPALLPCTCMFPLILTNVCSLSSYACHGELLKTGQYTHRQGTRPSQQVRLLDSDVLGPSLPNLLGVDIAGCPLLAGPRDCRHPTARLTCPPRAHLAAAGARRALHVCGLPHAPSCGGRVARGRPMVMAAVEKRHLAWSLPPARPEGNGGAMDVVVVMVAVDATGSAGSRQAPGCGGCTTPSAHPYCLAAHPPSTMRACTSHFTISSPACPSMSSLSFQAPGMVANTSNFTCPACSNHATIAGHGTPHHAAAHLPGLLQPRCWIGFLAEVDGFMAKMVAIRPPGLASLPFSPLCAHRVTAAPVSQPIPWILACGVHRAPARLTALSPYLSFTRQPFCPRLFPLNPSPPSSDSLPSIIPSARCTSRGLHQFVTPLSPLPPPLPDRLLWPCPPPIASCIPCVQIMQGGVVSYPAHATDANSGRTSQLAGYPGLPHGRQPLEQARSGGDSEEQQQQRNFKQRREGQVGAGNGLLAFKLRQGLWEWVAEGGDKEGGAKAEEEWLEKLLEIMLLQDEVRTK
ncbi:unnamed protein product [Closterium sp. NIES-65]|nr:unnamed protein product [Closterium sp. NIES-65]